MNDAINRTEALTCPNCGASIDFLPSISSVFQCEYCGSTIRINREPQGVNYNIIENLEHITPEKVIQRVEHLFSMCKDEQAKQLLEKVLLLYPSNDILLELENQSECFLTRNFGNYLKMLSVRSFLTNGECLRYKTEINGFCKMVGDKAINSLNTPMQRKQNTENYEAILGYIESLKKCLQNDAIIHCDELYATIIDAVLKLIAIVCNTIYIKNTRKPKQYIMLIDFRYRRQLTLDFDSINLVCKSKYRIVDEKIIRQYISGGKYE